MKIASPSASNPLSLPDQQAPHICSKTPKQLKLWKSAKLASIAWIACFGMTHTVIAEPNSVIPLIGIPGEKGEAGADNEVPDVEFGGTGGQGADGAIGLAITNSDKALYSETVVGGTGGEGGKGGDNYHDHDAHAKTTRPSDEHIHGTGGGGGKGGNGGTGITADKEVTFDGIATGGKGGRGGAGGHGLEGTKAEHEKHEEEEEEEDHHHVVGEEHNGGSGGTGGIGGDGFIAPSLINQGIITGGEGGDGGALGKGSSGIGSQGNGGAGGTGAITSKLINHGTIKGGAGGSGEGEPQNALGGNGGTAVLAQQPANIINNGNIIGGNGSLGGTNGVGGDGGHGLIALDESAITNNSVIKGGDGSTDGHGAVGVYFNGTLENTGLISGGDGGLMRSSVNTIINGTPINIAENAGIVVGAGKPGKIINRGKIIGGYGQETILVLERRTASIPEKLKSSISEQSMIPGQQGAFGPAIQFDNKNSKGDLTIYPDSQIIGNVLAHEAINLHFAGSGQGSFDVSKIGPQTQYRGFGGFSKVDSGTWTLVGETDAAMPLVLSKGILAISSKRGLGDDTGSLILNGGTLKTTKEMELAKPILLSRKGGTIENDKALSLSGVVQLFGPFTKTGAGRLALLAKNSYTGETIVESGELNIAAEAAITSNTTVKRLGHLSVDGTAQDVTLNSGSRISGIGTIGNLIVKSGATVSPGNSVGTLNLGKDVTFNKGGIFDTEIKQDFSQADQLSVQGSAKLLGGVVDIRLENDLAVLTEDMSKSLLSKSYDILVAKGGVTGQFDGVFSRYNYITPTLNYADTSKVVLGFEVAPTVKSAKTQELEKYLADIEVERKDIAAQLTKIAADADEAEKKRSIEAQAKHLDDVEIEKRITAERTNKLEKAEADEKKRVAEVLVKHKAEADEKARLIAEHAEKKQHVADTDAAHEKETTEARAKVEVEVEVEADIVANAKADTKVTTKTQVDAEAETAQVSDVDAKAKAEETARPITDAEAKAGAEVTTKAQADAEAETAQVSDVDAKAKAEETARPITDAEVLTKTETNTKADVSAKAQTGTEAIAKAQADAEAEKLRLAEVTEKLEAQLLQARIEAMLAPEFLAVGVATHNQKGAWSGIQSLGLSNIELLQQVMKSTIDNPLNFDALSGEVHVTLSGVLAQDNHFISDAATARLRNAFGGIAVKPQAVTAPLAYGPEGKKAKQAEAFAAIEPAAATTALWGEAYGSWAHADGDGNAAAYNRNTGGFVTGLDGVIAEDWRLGVLAGYGNTSLHGTGKASVDSYQLGVYGGTKLDALGLRFGVNLAQHEIETKRTAQFGSLSNEHQASYDAQSVQVFGELGYEINTPYAALEPFAAVRYVHVKTDGFGEDGAISNLTGAASSTDLTVTTLGLRASRQFALSDSTTLTARGMLGWNHGFGDVTPEASLAFNGGKAFAIKGASMAKDAAVVEAGLDFGIGKATSIGVSYTGQFSSQSHDNAIKADLSVRF